MAEHWTDSSGSVDRIVLAGDRRPDDPLAVSAGVSGKALVPVAGQAMLAHVVRTLMTWPRRGRVIVVAPDHQAYRKAAEEGAGGAADGLVWVEPAPSLTGSVSRALSCVRSPRCLLLTADHVLLDSAWLEHLLAADVARNASLAVGLADWNAVMARFPGSRRTRYRFSDHAACGTNLFLINERAGVDRILAQWNKVEQQRKKPWRIVSMLGWGNLSRYLAGRLSLDEAFSSLSSKLGAQVQPILVPDPLAAVDVDSVADLALVEQVLAQRAAS
ncbi:MAG: nucleotidyltransferase family protein [Wenzhouxiangella sp.]|jgi:CTP:molybdopterin cytidylyltransferase MocA|nr:nucleotidyltransferase family protein [Wenzhouxiangella sp.]